MQEDEFIIKYFYRFSFLLIKLNNRIVEKVVMTFVERFESAPWRIKDLSSISIELMSALQAQ